MPAITLLRTAAGAALCIIGSTAAAATFTFDTPPFAGSTALETPGRQIVGGELFIPDFDIANDVLAFNSSVFAVPSTLSFFSGEAAGIPASGTHFIVLRTFDFDGDPNNGIALNAGQAANLIAGAVGAPGAGFFIYFNSGLNLPRLVYSTNLDSAESDLKILARFTNLTGDDGRAALGRITAGNIAAVPEPASWAMLIAGFGLVGAAVRRRRAFPSEVCL
jgi:PEP-CTERM motif